MDTTRTVFLGSLPFDQTEEQVLEIARSIGPVEDMKLLFDPTTGRLKGSAYVQYVDHETAASAVRNLNNFAVGNRLLSCLFSSDNAMTAAANGGGNAFGNGPSEGSSTSLPTLPPGMQLFAGQTAPQAVTNALSSLDLPSALQLVKEAVTMATTNPQLTKTLFDQCPQLAHALVETCLRLQLIGQETIQLLLNKKGNELVQLTPEHVSLLRNVTTLTEEEKRALPADQRAVLEQVQTGIKNGAFGEIE
mgnify:CR=1 FL=1